MKIYTFTLPIDLDQFEQQRIQLDSAINCLRRKILPSPPSLIPAHIEALEGIQTMFNTIYEEISPPKEENYLDHED